MRKIFSCFLLMFFSVFLNANEEEIVAPPNIYDNMVLKVGTNANYQPFEYVNMSMEIVGFDIDLIKEISKRANFKFEIIEMSFDILLKELEDGKIDLAISAIGISEDRRSTLDFSKPYFNTETLYVKRRADNRIKDKSELRDKNVGVQEGTTQEDVAKKIDGIILHPFATDTALISGLKSGILDAVILDSAVGLGYLNKNPDLIEFLREPDGTNGLGIALKKGKYPELLTKINLVISDIIADGTYDKLLVKYGLK